MVVVGGIEIETLALKLIDFIGKASYHSAA
jgi:hypothetical protein